MSLYVQNGGGIVQLKSIVSWPGHGDMVLYQRPEGGEQFVLPREEWVKQFKPLGTEALPELFATLNQVEEQWKDWCADCDNQDGLEPGTTYHSEHVPDMEFYIESNDWHTISKALRRIGK